MKRSLVGALTTLLLAGAMLTGTGQAAAAPVAREKAEPAAASFAGTVALSNCSGSVVSLPSSQPADPALVLSNGHCLESGFPSAGEVVVDRPSNRSFTLLRADGSAAGTLRADRIAYGTMTDTDVSVYRLTTTYQQIEAQYGVRALELLGTRPAAGTPVSVVSGYWKRVYDCAVDGFAHRLREGEWTWKDSVRYTTPGCDVIGGTSGSPVVNSAGQVVAVNNTINESGGRCTLNNPCEVDENGSVTVREGVGYAQQTYLLAACFEAGNQLDLDAAGCALPRP